MNTYDTQSNILVWTDYYSPTVTHVVKEVDDGDDDETQTMVLVSYNLVR